MKSRILVLWAISALGILSFKPVLAQDDLHKVTVKEIIATTSYTYVLGVENGKELWMAMPKAAVEVGKDYYFKGSMEMTKFHSKELDRNFETIWFIEGLSTNPNHPIVKDPAGSFHKTPLYVEPKDGSISLAELAKNKKKLEGKTVKIRGKVVKFSANIMDTNWMHIQDGTNHDSFNDLTVTTNVTANVGDIITLEGKLVLNKDIGHGYFFEILLADASKVE